MLQPITLYLITTVLCLLLSIFQSHPFIQHRLYLYFALIYIYIPFFVIWYEQEKLSDFGLGRPNIKKELGLLLIPTIIIFPLYVIGFSALQIYGLEKTSLFHISPVLIGTLGFQLFFIALPEEFFFRGYLQTKLSGVFEGRRLGGRFLGDFLFFDNIITSLLFASAHLVIYRDVSKLLIFFPSLIFGWQRQKSGNIWVPIIFHAFCNTIDIFLYHSFF